MKWWEDFFQQRARQLKWFEPKMTLDDVKHRYRELMKEHHPDHGGNEEIAKAINDEYDLALKRAVRDSPKSDKDDFDLHGHATKTKWWFDGQGFHYKRGFGLHYTDKFWETLGEATRVFNCGIEVIGTWIWLWELSNVQVLQAVGMGFTHSPKHKGWFWYDPEVQDWNRRIGPKREYTTDDLRNMWGAKKHKDKQFLGGQNGEI